MFSSCRDFPLKIDLINNMNGIGITERKEKQCRWGHMSVKGYIFLETVIIASVRWVMMIICERFHCERVSIV